MLFLFTVLLGTAEAEYCLNKGVLDTNTSPHKCLQLVHSQQIYDDAGTICGDLSYGATLTSITNAFEQALIVGQSHDKLELEDYWIGLTNLIDVKQWQWDDESPLNFTNWMIDPSSNDPAHNNCVSGRLSTGKWYNLNCDTEKRSFVCKYNTIDLPTTTETTVLCAPSTADGMTFSKCYLAFVSQQQYADAEMVCAAFDGDLVSIYNVTEMTHVTEIAKNSKLRSKEFWIGLNNFFNGVDWHWTGSTDSNYTNWANGAPPKNVGAADGCVSASVRTGKWQNRPCNSLLSFVCELPPIEVTPSPPPPTCPSASSFPAGGSSPCDDNWIYFPATNFCYLGIRHDGIGSLYDALEQRCVELGGHLASIHSFSEENFIIGIGTGVANDLAHLTAIGYRSYSDADSFQWSDGSLTDYVHWAKGWEPTNDRLCASVQRHLDGFLSDGCSDTAFDPGVCKKSAH